MSTPKALVIALATVVLAIAIGAMLLWSTPKRSGERAAAASVNPDDRGLARAMNFTEPKQ